MPGHTATVVDPGGTTQALLVNVRETLHEFLSSLILTFLKTEFYAGAGLDLHRRSSSISDNAMSPVVPTVSSAALPGSLTRLDQPASASSPQLDTTAEQINSGDSSNMTASLDAKVSPGFDAENEQAALTVHLDVSTSGQVLLRLVPGEFVLFPTAWLNMMLSHNK